MRFNKNDLMFVALIVVVVGFLLYITKPETTKKVPYDDKHQQFYQIYKQTENKMDMDKGCPTCHNEQGGIPFPAKHPVKPKDGPMRCTFCHKLIDKYK